MSIVKLATTLYKAAKSVPPELRPKLVELVVDVVRGENPLDNASEAYRLTQEMGFKRGYS